VTLRPDGSDQDEKRSFLVEGAHLDRVVAGDRMGGRELDRLLVIGAADDVDAGDVVRGLAGRARTLSRA
jgi:hypothetical protein